MTGSLLPCPFCGCKQIEFKALENSDAGWFECWECKASGTGCGSSRRAARYWNTRTTRIGLVGTEDGFVTEEMHDSQLMAIREITNGLAENVGVARDAVLRASSPDETQALLVDLAHLSCVHGYRAGQNLRFDRNQLGTHWDGCWRAHHACAIVMLEEIIRDRAQATPSSKRIERLKDALEGECEGLSIDDWQARVILEYIDTGIAIFRDENGVIYTEEDRPNVGDKP